MAKTTEAGAVPRLRFPEFRAAREWTVKSLNAVCTVNPPSDDLPESFVYIDLESVERGTLKARTRISKSIAPSRAQRLLRNGDVLFQIVRPYQRNNLYVHFDDADCYVASTGYAQLRAHGSSRFLYQAVHSDQFVDGVIAKCTGSSYPAINTADLADVAILVPPTIQEEVRIADCLTSLDDVIAAQAQKVEALKTHKRGLIQQLFPREGATVPRVQFSGSATASPWPLTRLGDVLSELKRRSDGAARVHSVSVHKGLIDQIEHLGRSFAAADTSKYSLVSPSDVVYTKSPTGDFPYGIVKQSHLDHDAIVSPLYGVFTPLNRHVGRIIEAYFDAPQRAARYLAPIITKGAKNTIQISNTKFLSKGIPLPTRENEQRQVADCLTSADASIDAATAKLEALWAHKTALMQQLFPSPKGA